ncbi:MAG: hypothetical protein ACFFAO_17530 [Candidatus Hermodarchaeota archaeon]
MINIKNNFKIVFLIGLVLLFTSFFLDWYIIQVFNSERKLIAYWSYNPLFEWKTIFSDQAIFNNSIRPKDLKVSPILAGIYFICLILSAYSAIFYDLEKKDNLEKIQRYAYVNLFLLSLVLFYLFVFPAFYLLPNKLYYPFLRIIDKDSNYTYYYSIGLGYILQMIGFVLIFPYTIFYYQTAVKFRLQIYTPKKIVDNYLETFQETIDIDKLIAQEELKSKLGEVSSKKFKNFAYNHKKTIKKRA